MCAALVKTPFVEAVVKLYNRWGGYSQREPARNAWGPAKVLEALARLLENAAAGMRVRGKDRAARLVDEFHERTKAALYDGQFLAQVVESHCNVLVDEKHELVTQVLCEGLDEQDSHSVENTVQLIIDCLQDDADRVIHVVRDLLSVRPQLAEIVAREVKHLSNQPETLSKMAFSRDEQVIRTLEAAAAVLSHEDLVSSGFHEFGRRWLGDAQERVHAEEFAACLEAYDVEPPSPEERGPRRENRGAPAA